MERRMFLKKAVALGIGLCVLVRGRKVTAKGLPSDPGTTSGAPPTPDVIPLPPFEKNSPFTLRTGSAYSNKIGRRATAPCPRIGDLSHASCEPPKAPRQSTTGGWTS